MNEIARTIYDQLGGVKFCTMTGARNFVYGDKNLYFRIGSNPSGFTNVEIKLEPTDTYCVTFTRWRGFDLQREKKVEGVMVENLRSVFEDNTKMRTSL